jgi:hypothetical protein
VSIQLQLNNNNNNMNSHFNECISPATGDPTLILFAKCRDIFVRFYQNLDFIDRFLYTSAVPNLTKIRQVGSELIHSTDGRAVEAT